MSKIRLAQILRLLRTWAQAWGTGNPQDWVRMSMQVRCGNFQSLQFASRSNIRWFMFPDLKKNESIAFRGVSALSAQFWEGLFSEDVFCFEVGTTEKATHRRHAIIDVEDISRKATCCRRWLIRSWPIPSWWCLSRLWRQRRSAATWLCTCLYSQLPFQRNWSDVKIFSFYIPNRYHHVKLTERR